MSDCKSDSTFDDFCNDLDNNLSQLIGKVTEITKQSDKQTVEDVSLIQQKSDKIQSIVQYIKALYEISEIDRKEHQKKSEDISDELNKIQSKLRLIVSRNIEQEEAKKQGN